MYRRTLVEARQPNRRPQGLGAELSFISREQERIAQERRITADLSAHIEDALRYEQWKRDNGVPERLTRAQFCEEFGITA